MSPNLHKFSALSDKIKCIATKPISHLHREALADLAEFGDLCNAIKFRKHGFLTKEETVSMYYLFKNLSIPFVNMLAKLLKAGIITMDFWKYRTRFGIRLKSNAQRWKRLHFSDLIKDVKVEARPGEFVLISKSGIRLTFTNKSATIEC